LNLSKFVFYRSSAVGLQALNSNITPVFYSAPGFSMLNVLPPISNLFYSVNNFKTALDLVAKPHNKKSIKNKKIIFNSLFSELKYQNLDSILAKN
jgi:hypothetical protein